MNAFLRARAPRFAILALLAASASGCHAWHADGRPLTEIVRGDAPEQLRLRRTDGSVIVLRSPRVVADTTRALGTGAVEEGASDTLVAGALVARSLASGETARGGGRRNATVLVRTSEVNRVETLRYSRSRTWLAVAAGVAFVTMVVLVGPYGDGPR